jgi:hypothetical protein
VQARVQVLRKLLRESMYVVDEREVADAILLRALLRHTVPEPSFRSEHRGRHVRSFRRDRDARSFRLSGNTHFRGAHR